MNLSPLALTALLVLTPIALHAQDTPPVSPPENTATSEVASWDSTFTLKTLEPHDTRSIIVVAAGEGEAYESAAQAAQQFLKVVQSKPNTTLAMDAASLGATKGGSDEAILLKAKALPVETVVLLRTFATNTAGQYTLVVNWFDKSTGALRYAQSVRQGEPLPAPPAQSQMGVSVATQKAVEEQQEEAKVDIDEAIKAYESSYVWFEDWTGINSQTGQVVANWTVPYKGKFKETLEHEEFYEAIDQPELADEYLSSLYLKRSFQITGGIALLGGLAYMLYVPVSKLDDDCNTNDADGFSVTNQACEDKKSEEIDDALILGGSISVAGLVLTAIGAFINPHPVEPPEARRMAAEFNEKKRKELGLPKGKESSPFRMDLDLYPSKEGGNIQLKMTY